MSKFIIYALVYDASQRMYIGKSSSGLSRPSAHSTDGALSRKHTRTPVTNWINKYKKITGQRPAIVVLEELDSESALNEAEKFYIGYFKSIGAQLLNLTDGGEGAPGYKQSAETKEKRAVKLRGQKRSEEVRRKISINSTRAMSTPEARERSAAPNRGRLLPEPSRKAIAEKLAALPMTEERLASLVKARVFGVAARSTVRKKLDSLIGTEPLSEWRANKGMSLTDVSKSFGMPLNSLARIEKKEPAESRARAKAVSAEKISIVSKRAWAAGAFVARCNSQRGQKRPEEVCQKMRGRRRKFSDETREKMSRSARLRGKPRVRINLLRAA
jgi:transcriptional regulator with XRE-family HTH domain